MIIFREKEFGVATKDLKKIMKLQEEIADGITKGKLANPKFKDHSSFDRKIEQYLSLTKRVSKRAAKDTRTRGHEGEGSILNTKLYDRVKHLDSDKSFEKK